MRFIVIIGIVILLFTACKPAEDQFTEDDIRRTREMVENADYEIALQFAQPMVSNELNQIYNSNLLPVESRSYRISLAGTPNYIRKIGDSISMSLSFFGTRQMSVSMTNSDGGIDFEGVPDRYDYNYDEKRQRSIVTFRGKNRTEYHNVSVFVFPNKRVQVNVNSSHRNNISYTGYLKEIDPE